jgi:lipopolysaccharide transport system permease protein
MPRTATQKSTITHISAEHSLLDLKLDEVWAYRDLIWLYARRTVVSMYKQTILGPLWLILNPLVTSVVYLIVFGNIAGLSTGGVPKILFYLLSNATWSLFATVINQSSDTFVQNSSLYGKVYFPRLTIPIANALVALLQFGIQFMLVTCIGIYYMATSSFAFTFAHWIVLPLLLVLTITIAMGFGIIASSLTTRYRDLRILVGFGVRLWMYVTPVVYPMEQFSDGLLKRILMLNPMTVPLEGVRWCMWGSPAPSLGSVTLSCATALVVITLGIMLFNKVERTFMDTV